MDTLRPLPRYPEPAPGIDLLTTTLPGHPLAKLAYTLAEPHLSGHRLILGFPTRTDAMAAHDWLFAQIQAATITEPNDILVLARRLGELNRTLYGGGNTDYLDAVEMLVDCSDAIATMTRELARHQATIERQATIIARVRVMAPLAFHVMEKKE